MQHSIPLAPTFEFSASDPSWSETDKASDTTLFKTGMRTLASGICVVTTMGAEGPAGLLSTSVSSVSVDPPLLLVCINRSASAYGAMLESGAYCVNVLGGEDEPIARLFGTSQARDARFRDRSWLPLATGAPALEGCLASFDCRCVGNIDIASHTVFFGRVAAVRLWKDAQDPLLYWQGQYRWGVA